MRPLTPVDVASIRLFITQLFDDNFLFDTQIIGGVLVLNILGRPGAIPDDYCDTIIEELKEYRYVGQKIDVVGFGQSVVVKGVE